MLHGPLETDLGLGVPAIEQGLLLPAHADDAEECGVLAVDPLVAAPHLDQALDHGVVLGKLEAHLEHIVLPRGLVTQHRGQRSTEAQQAGVLGVITIAQGDDGLLLGHRYGLPMTW